MSEQENNEKNTPEGVPESGASESGAPEGTTEPGALFDLMGEENPKKARKKADARAKPGEEKGGSGKAQKQAQAKAEPVKYKEGTEVRYQRHSLALPREMTAITGKPALSHSFASRHIRSPSAGSLDQDAVARSPAAVSASAMRPGVVPNNPPK